MGDERWQTIAEFPNYDVSDQGRIYNRKHHMSMSVSYTNHGHSKITLTDYVGVRFTRSVAQLVADAFVEPPNLLCDQIIVLNGDFTDVRAENLAWRPRHFAWKYTRQIKEPQPLHYHNLPVLNTIDGIYYDSIIAAGVTEGLLFDDIWESTYSKRPVYPTGSVFEVTERV